MDKGIILHVSEVEVTPKSGMGRIEYYWKEAIEQAGYKFVHIGPKEVAPIKHPAFLPSKAYEYYKSLNIKPKAIIVHEPASGKFVNEGIPCFVESHGIERRYWEAQLQGLVPPPMGDKVSLKTKLLFPLWRLRGCEKGLRKATKLLLSNTDDEKYAISEYHRHKEDILVFKNGVSSATASDPYKNSDKFTVLFNATWQERKGVKVLVSAAELLHKQGLAINYLLVGTGKSADEVLNDWPEQLKPFVTVISKFAPEDEPKFLNSASIFVLPSYFEGQPLSLLEAMAAGKCCVTTNSCGQKDVISDGENGLLFEVGDFNGLASAIKKCYKNEEVINMLGLNAKKYTGNLPWKKVSKEVIDFILKSI